MLEQALDKELIDVDHLKSLREIKSIPNKDRRLYPPSWLFFENRTGLADKFGSFLEGNIIHRELGTYRAFLAAGVQQLGSAVKVELVRYKVPGDDPNTTKGIQQRRREIARVLASQEAASLDVQNTLDTLGRLNCKSAANLEIQYRLCAFNQEIESGIESALSIYQPDDQSIWTVSQNGEMPWAPLARELAMALCPDEEPGLLAVGLKEVLAAETTAKAAAALNDLGFPQLDMPFSEPAPSQEAAGQLGTDDPIDDEALPPGHSGAGTQLNPIPTVEVQPSTESGLPAEEGVLQGLDIEQSESPQVVEGPDSKRAAGTIGGRPEAQPGRGKARTRDAARSRAGMKFKSYIAVSLDDEEEVDSDGLTHHERMDLEDKAVKLIHEREPRLERMPPNNRGFDLIERGADGQFIRWVEVKAMTDSLHDRPVGLSRTQFECAQERGGAYWLYVVENAGEAEQANLVRIQDPAGKAGTFTFDGGWIAVAEDTETADS